MATKKQKEKATRQAKEREATDDALEHERTAEAEKGEEKEEDRGELVRVQVGPVGVGGQHINGHFCKDGQHVMMFQDQIDHYREHGVPLIHVDQEAEHEDEALDVSEDVVTEAPEAVE